VGPQQRPLCRARTDAWARARAQLAIKNCKAMNPAGKVRPTVLALSRQAMPNLPGTSREGAAKGGYIVHGGDEKPDVIIMGTGAARRRLRGPSASCCWSRKCVRLGRICIKLADVTILSRHAAAGGGDDEHASQLLVTLLLQGMLRVVAV